MKEFFLEYLLPSSSILWVILLNQIFNVMVLGWLQISAKPEIVKVPERRLKEVKHSLSIAMTILIVLIDCILIILKMNYYYFNYVFQIILVILKSLNYLVFNLISLLIPVVLTIAFLTLLERKVIGSSQNRIGPNTIGVFGILQPIADGLKLFLKEIIIPSKADKTIFILSPISVFGFSLIQWLVLPVSYGKVFADVNLGILYFFAFSSLTVYGIVLAGWSSNSKYAFLGALRSAAQMISYEVSIGLILLSVVFSVKSLNLTEIVYFQEEIWLIIPHFGSFILFLISALAETNRAPFDLPEAEAELVSGYNVEYSGISFALFFLAEYSNIILISTFISIIFLGGWSYFFVLKVLSLLIWFIWVRTTLPRFRYDQLMLLGWKVFLPISLFLVIWNLGISFLLI